MIEPCGAEVAEVAEVTNVTKKQIIVTPQEENTM